MNWHQQVEPAELIRASQESFLGIFMPAAKAEANEATPDANFKYGPHQKLLRFVCRLLASFNGVDLFATEQPSPQETGEDKSRPKWPAIVRYLYVHCSARLMLNCVLQYVYDFHLLELENLQQQQQQHQIGGVNQTLTPEIGKLQQQISHERSRIKLLGSPYMNVSYLLEVGYIYLTWYSFAFFGQPQLYQRFFMGDTSFNSGLLRILVDRERELANCRRLVAQEANRYLNSSRNFVLCVTRRMKWNPSASQKHVGDTNLLTFHMKLANLYSKQRHADLLDHTFTAKTLNGLCSSSQNAQFRPLNRTEDWIRVMSVLSILLQATFFVCGAGVIYFLTFYITGHDEWLGGIKLERDFMDVVMRVEILILCAISVLSSLFQLTTLGLTTIDQIYYLLELRVMVRDCARLTGEMILQIDIRKAARAKDKDRCLGENKTPAQRDALNGRILEFVLQYRVLVRQMRAIRKTCGYMAFSTIQAMVLIPILTIIHAPMFKHSMIIVLFVCTIVALIWLNICLTPACYMHSRGVDIYRSMSHLLADIALLRQVGRNSLGSHPLNSHLILSLRRELSLPERMIDQFTFKVLGLPLTYQNILKTQFWCSLLILFALAIFYASSGGGSTTKSFANTLMIL